MTKSLLVGEYFAETKEDWLELIKELDYRHRQGDIHYEVYHMTLDRYYAEIKKLEETDGQ